MTTTNTNCTAESIRQQTLNTLSRLDLLCFIFSHEGDIPNEIRVMGLHDYVNQIKQEITDITDQLERLSKKQ